MGADSARTRAAIVHAARDVINERGYSAATFQAIAQRAGLGRPTLHYYFSTREEVYDSVVVETAEVLAKCIATAERADTLPGRLTAFMQAAGRVAAADRSVFVFLVVSVLESERHPGLSSRGNTVVAATRTFLEWAVADAARRGELASEADVEQVVELLVAMLWGMALYSGFVADPADLAATDLVAKQLDRVFARGLLAAQPHDTHTDTPRSVGGPP